MAGEDWTSSSAAYVRPPDEGAPDAWSAELAARGVRGGQRILHAGEVPASVEVAELLGVAAGDVVVARRRLMLREDEPSELTDTYYPVRVARGTALASTARIRGGAARLLAELGFAGARVVEDVTARLPTRPEQSLLGLAAEQPVLTVARVTFDAQDSRIQADLMTMPAHLQRLRYETRIGSADRAHD
ncbi:UTRA domain-containing protein [Streptomyces fuscigenes]|uniref:UTRA domain-containing protein n=1 Tax=Streptomyces fuscigenes TaxID=1528880 RepID=UPI001F1C351C|nr:UTRA domain-containing protein [Streptomyces fuscigenes]MCF3963186.1 UTRA domain-containing protein [Streptomyces fuscigenes]